MFVDNVRFWSMFSIVAVHSYVLLGMSGVNPRLALALVTPFKFATIGFFLIAGFLMGERVDRRKPVEYFQRRFGKVFAPWLLWFGIMCALLVVREVIRRGLGTLAPHDLLSMTFTISRGVLYDTAFWFVPNLLLSMAILLICRRWLYNPKFGLVLRAFNLAYVANIYALWFPPNHTRARLAFVVYLWLGSYVAQNFKKVDHLLSRIPASAFFAATVVSGILAYRESCMLSALNNPDVLNTLRPTNQIFSVFMVLLIFKFSRATWPSFVDVRRHTFGLYLSHSIVLLFVMRSLKHCRNWMSDSLSTRTIEGVLLWFAAMGFTYMVCFLVTAWLARKPALQWMVGASSPTLPQLSTADISGLPHALQR